MTLPRAVIPGQHYFLTRRCTQRMFLMRPDAETNNAFVYCLGEAAKRFDVGIVFTTTMSNHHHTIIYDKLGNYPRFLERFHKLFARYMNAMRGRSENFWSAEQASVVLLARPEDVLAKLIYCATNPVNAHLVERANEWPGINALDNFLNGTPLRAKRPDKFFVDSGAMPDDITIDLTPLDPELGTLKQVRAHVRGFVAFVEDRMKAERRRTKRRVVGVVGVLAQRWDECPRTFAARFKLKPTVAAKNKWARIETLQRKHAFVEAYNDARRRWKEKRMFAFPIGTYWLHRIAHVPLTNALYELTLALELAPAS